MALQVGSQTGEDAAVSFGMPFMEVSAKSGDNVKRAFITAATRAVQGYFSRPRDSRVPGRAQKSRLHGMRVSVTAADNDFAGVPSSSAFRFRIDDTPLYEVLF